MTVTEIAAAIDVPKRFWASVDTTTFGECWIWTGQRRRDGYGVFVVGGRKYGAHRYSLMLTGRTLESGEFVCHRCDVKACVRPSHLFVGDALANNRDARDKGRYSNRPSFPSPGERNGSAKITTNDVHCIRALYAKGCLQKEIAEMFGLGQSHISRIIRGESWKHLL